MSLHLEFQFLSHFCPRGTDRNVRDRKDTIFSAVFTTFVCTLLKDPQCCYSQNGMIQDDTSRMQAHEQS